ncbi:MAG: lipoate--protein ligase family protein [Chloroflexota bacterium]|nr:lipoate--protein ligase family protein [Chloroflexota bacterium]
MPSLRLLRLGPVSGLHSQILYHALARSVSKGGPNSLAILSPTEPYVSVGFHRDVASEVDLEFCRARGIPVYRREVGGGPVYLDGNQVFFQLAVHHRDAPPTVERCYASWLRPVLETYRALGVPAEISSMSDLTVEGRKLSGTAMARIEDATVLVGNIILDFDHATMARVLRVPDAAFRAEVEKRMRASVSSLRAELGRLVSHETVEDELVRQFERALGVELVQGELREPEQQLLRQTERWFLSPRWRRARAGKPSAVRRVKIRGGLHVLLATSGAGRRGQLRAMVAAEGGCIARLQFSGRAGDRPAGLQQLEAALAGRAFTVSEIERAIAAQDGLADPAALAAARTCLLQAAAQVLD